MKHKHISITALVAVLVVMSITTTVFASSAPEGKSGTEPQEEQNALLAGYVTPLEEDGVMMLSKGPDGEKEYSVDGGKTWMSEERYQAEYGSWGNDWEVEWWTYADYKAWLEQEKKDLQETIGSQCWTPSTGWFTWDQAMVDETIAMYEGILEDIKNGALYSRTIIDKNGNEIEDVALGSNAPLDMVITSVFDETKENWTTPASEDGNASRIVLNTGLGQYGQEHLLVPANTTICLPCDLVFTLDSSYAYLSILCSDSITVKMTDTHQNTVPVLAEKYLCEKLFPGAAGTYQVSLTNDTDQDVMIDFVTFTNSEWEINGKSLAYWESVGIAHYVETAKGTAFALGTENSQDMVSAAPKAVDKAALQEELKAFGIGGNENLMTYNGQLVRTLVDGAPVRDNGYSVQYVYTNPDGVVDLHTLRAVIHYPDGSYDTMGDLIGVAAKGDRDFDQELIDCAALSGGPQATCAEGNGDGRGTTFEEIFARYEPYGLTYQPRESGMGAMAFNGQPVRSFADLKPGGGAFSYEDPYAQEGLTLHAVYEEGKLAGLSAK